MSILSMRFQVTINGLLVLLGSTFLSAVTQALPAISLDEVGSGELLFKTDQAGSYRPAVQLSSEADIQISGLVATVTLKQHFSNSGPDWVEGLYVFPLPEEAAVNAMSIQIGERIIVGEIHEKQQARKQYQKARASGKKAALVEQRRPNMFATAVANIGPGQEIVVNLAYVQKIAYTGQRFELRFPMTITPRYMPGRPLEAAEGVLRTAPGKGWAIDTDQVPDASEISPFLDPREAVPGKLINPISLTVSLDAGLPLGEVSSPYHDIQVSRAAGIYSIELAAGQVSMDRDFVLHWQPTQSKAPQAALFNEQREGHSYVLAMLLPPQDRTATATLARESIFVVDTSGSMGGVSIRQAKAALQHALTRLGPTDWFNIVEFNSTTRKLFRQSQPADSRLLAMAQGFVASLNAGGGTEMAAAIDVALRDGSEVPVDLLRQVIFITDGAVGNEQALFQQIQRDLGERRFFTVGIGSAPNSFFMRKAAQFGRGSFTYIGDQAEVRQAMNDLFEQLANPVLGDIEMQWPDGVNALVNPHRIPDLYRGQPLMISARLDNSNGALAVSGRLPGGDWQRSLELGGGRQSSGVAALWARERIAGLNDQIAVDGASESLRQEVLDIAMRHQLVSRYTSFLAVEKTPSRPAEQSLKSKNVANARPRGQTTQPFAYPQTATPALLQFWLGTLALVLALLLKIPGRYRAPAR